MSKEALDILITALSASLALNVALAMTIYMLNKQKRLYRDHAAKLQAALLIAKESKKC